MRAEIGKLRGLKKASVGKAPLVSSSLSFHRLFASVTELADVSASEADVFMALRVRVPPLAFLN